MFLHGVETKEQGSGFRPIALSETSVIGIVGTAPDAEEATAASLTLGSGVLDNMLVFTAVLSGTRGNAISVELAPGTEDTESVSLSTQGNLVRVVLPLDSEGDVSATADDVVEAFRTSEASEVTDLVRVEHGSTTSGTGVVLATLAPRFLSGGASEPFPLNTPTLVHGSRSQMVRLGARGTLPKALNGIFDQIGASVVVIRVAEGQEATGTMANVIGGAGTGDGAHGIQALLEAKSEVAVTPRVLIAPGFTDEVAVTTELISVARRIKAIVLADGPNTTSKEAIDQRQKFGSDRLMLLFPWLKVFDPDVQENVNDPPSSRVAGVVARTDNEKGFWWSPSNKLVHGVVGVSRRVSFSLSDPNSEANHLNSNEVTTFVQQNGLRVWGNRSTTADSLWAFISVRRTADIIEESIEESMLWAMDRPFSGQLLNDMRDGVQEFLRSLETSGAVLGSNVWIDPEENTEATLKAGRLFMAYDFEPPAPLERLTFRAIRNGDYYTDLVSEVAA